MNKKIALNTDQIDNLLKNCTKFKGAYACDQIPNVNDSEYSLIVNTDVSELPGQHWTALMFKGNNVYYFDSFGRLFDNFSFPDDYRTYLRQLCGSKKVYFQNKVLQGFHSNTCGEYCVYFVKQMEKNVPFSSIFRNFSDNLKANDLIILKLFKND